MGGADSEIGATTRDVLIEAAAFDSLSVRATSRKLAMQTDASQRFGRGVDPESVIAAQSLAARLLVDLGGGTPAPGLVDVHPRPYRPEKLVLRLAQLQRLLGYKPGVTEVRRALAALQLEPEKLDAKRFEITVPSWRVDLEREADLVEEVARHLGYDRVPADASGMPTLGVVAEGGGAEERVRDLLAHGGFCEAIGYAMIGDGEDAAYVEHDAVPAVALTNPIADWLACLRRSILPGLVRAADLNHRRGVRDVRLFEIGRVFQAAGRDAFPREPLRVGLAWSGAARPLHWDGRNREVDLFDMMGVVESLLRRLSPSALPVPRPAAFEGLHPGRSVTWATASGERAAWCGALHPDLQSALTHPLLLAEVELDRLDSGALPIAQYAALPRLTAVSRDISLVLRPEVTYSSVLEVMTAIEPPAPVSFRVADRYEGPPLEPGEVSLMIRLVLQPSEKTLTDGEIDGYRLALIGGLKESLGLRIRD
jgi:phenylalanyl-tRNA synthetase beta chain